MGSTRNPRIPEWSSGGRKDSNRRPATGRLPRRTTGTPQPTEAPPSSSFIPDEFRTENDLPIVPESPQLQGAPKDGVETHLNIPLDQDAAAIAAADSGPGQTQTTLFADKYELLVKVGEGGMGSVYKAHNKLLGVDVALKVLTPEKITSPDVRERFLREARATQMFRHRHAIAVQEVGELDDGTVYLTMDFSSGENLDARIRRLGRLSLDEAILITLQVLDALAEAHRTGIVHRDLKPGNIMVEIVSGKPSAMVVDFGIAKILQDTGIVRGHAPLTSPGLILGTVEYMSPEQAGGAVVDARSDIYSMGAVLYHMFTGQLPSPSDTVQNMIINIMFQPPTPIREIVTDGTIPPEVEAVVMKALSKSTDERYQSAHEFAEALRVASADYLPDDTRTQSSSFRLPVTMVNDHTNMPTQMFAPPPEAAPAPASSRFEMGQAQKVLAFVAVLLLLAVIGIAVYKKIGPATGAEKVRQVQMLSDLQQDAQRTGDWEKLRSTAHDLAVADPKNTTAARFEWIAGAEQALKQALLFGPRSPQNYRPALADAEQALAAHTTADSPEFHDLQGQYEPRLKQADALLDAYTKLNDADKALHNLDYGKTLQCLTEADMLFQAASQPPPAHLIELRVRANYRLALQRASDAKIAALEVEASPLSPQDKSDRAWQKMLDELRGALKLEILKPDGTLPAEAQDSYRQGLLEFLKATHDRALSTMPPGAVGELPDADLLQLPQLVDLAHDFLKHRQEPLAVPCAPDRPLTLGAFVTDGAFQSMRDEVDLKFADRLQREADIQVKHYRFDVAQLLYKKALVIALPETLPALRKKLDDAGNLQADMEALLKSAHRAHLDGQEVEAEALYNRFLQQYNGAPQAPQASAELKIIKAIIEKAVGFKLTSTPSGAEVFLNGQEHPIGHTPMILTADSGLALNQNNTIELRLPGFDPMTLTRRFIGGGLVPIDFTLQPKLGKLTVRVFEPNVWVIVTPVDVNDKPADMPWDRKHTNADGEWTWNNIPEGRYVIDVQPPIGFTPVRLLVTVAEGALTPPPGPGPGPGPGPANVGKPTVVEVKLQAAPASLVLRTEPPGLKVLVNGAEQANPTPLTLDLPAGPVRVVVVANDGFLLPLDFVLKAGEKSRPPVIQVDFENDDQRQAWAALKSVMENPQSTPAVKVAAELAFLAQCGSHARANKVRVDLDDQTPAYLRTLQGDPAGYLGFVGDYLHTMPDGRWQSVFRGRVNTLLTFPYLFAAGRSYQSGIIKARATNGWDYLLRWGDNGMQLLSPRGESRVIYSGFGIHDVRVVQGCDDVVWVQERADDPAGHVRLLSGLVKQDRPGDLQDLTSRHSDKFAEYGLVSAPVGDVVWFDPVTDGKLPTAGVFGLDWKDGYTCRVLPNGTSLVLSAASVEGGKIATTLQLLDSRPDPAIDDGKGNHYHAKVLATNTLEPISSAYTVFRVSPDGSMVILHAVNNGGDEYRVVRASNLNTNDYYMHVGKVNDLIFGSRGTRLVVHGPQTVEVHEIGGLNQLKRQISGVYDQVFLSADDQYLFLARASEFAVVEATGSAAPKDYPDQRLLAIDATRQRILCGKDGSLSWLYWKTGEMIKIADLEAIWKNAQGVVAGDTPPRLIQVTQVFLLNDGHCALQMQDGSVLYFDVNAPQRLGEQEIMLRDKLRDEIRRDEGK